MGEVLSDEARQILLALTQFYHTGEVTERVRSVQRPGKDSPALTDPDTGGLYENKLAVLLGLPLTGEEPSASFKAAIVELRTAGYIRRIRRTADPQAHGVWPTPAGLAAAEALV